MSLDQDVVLLQSVNPFRVLPPERCALLAISAEQRSLAAGAVLFRTGDGRRLRLLVMSGRVEVFTERAGKRRETFEAGPGALIGEMALILDRPRPATAVALDACSVMRIPRSTFLRVLEGFPEAAVAMHAAVSARVANLLRSLDTVRDRLETPIRPVRRR